MWWSPTLLTMRRSSGPGDQGLTAAHSAPMRGGGSCVATVCPWYWTMSSLSGRSKTSHPQSGVAGTFPIRQQLQDPPVVLHRVVPGPPLRVCLKHRVSERHRSAATGR